MKRLSLGLLLLVVGVAVAGPLSPQDNEVEQGRSEDGGWRLVLKVLGDCAERGDVLPCLGVKAVAMMQRAARTRDIELAEGVAFVQTAVDEDDRGGRALASEEELQSALLKGGDDQGGRLVDMLVDAAARFLKTHSLQFRLPQEVPAQLRALQEDGRGKKKKLLRLLMPLLMGVGAKLMLLLPLGIVAIGLLALKALFVSKLALVVGAVLAAQKLLGGGGGKGGLGGGWSSGASSGWSSAPATVAGSGWSSGGVASGPGGSSGWSRSIADDDAAHQMAYAAHAPQ